MKTLFAVGVVLFSAASLWAQSQFEIGVFTANAAGINVGIAINLLPLSSLPSLSNWLPPRALAASGDLSLTEASRVPLGDTLTLSPFPPLPLEDSSTVRITTTSVGLVDVSVQNLMNLIPISLGIQPATPLHGTIYEEDSSGAEMFSPSDGYERPQSPSISPPPGFRFQLNQAGIQPIPAPEPSTLALGGLALGLIAIARKSPFKSTRRS